MSSSPTNVMPVANHGEQGAIDDLSRFDIVLAAIDLERQKAEALTKAAERKANPLSVLPIEPRLHILSLVIDPISKPLFLPNRKTGAPPKFAVPAIARAFNLQNRLESISILLENSTLEIHSGPALTKTMAFLQHVDFNATKKDLRRDLGFDCVTSVRFPYFSRFPHPSLPATALNKDILFMRMCRNLERVSLTCVDAGLSSFVLGARFSPKSLARLRREYRLDGMLGLVKLRHLCLLSHSTDRVYEEAGLVGHRQVCALKAWFDEEFAKRGMEVDVTAS